MWFSIHIGKKNVGHCKVIRQLLGLKNIKNSKFKIFCPSCPPMLCAHSEGLNSSVSIMDPMKINHWFRVTLVSLFSPLLLLPLWISQFVYAINAKCDKLTVNRGSVNEVHILYIVYPFPVLTEGIKRVKFSALYLNLTFHRNDLFFAQEAQLSKNKKMLQCCTITEASSTLRNPMKMAEFIQAFICHISHY